MLMYLMYTQKKIYWKKLTTSCTRHEVPLKLRGTEVQPKQTIVIEVSKSLKYLVTPIQSSLNIIVQATVLNMFGFLKVEY